jgi:hypothetical protein
LFACTATAPLRTILHHFEDCVGFGLRQKAIAIGIDSFEESRNGHPNFGFG